MIFGYGGSSDANVTTTESSGPVDTQQTENSQSSPPNSTTAPAGSMAGYHRTLSLMKPPDSLFQPSPFTSRAPNPNQNGRLRGGTAPKNSSPSADSGPGDPAHTFTLTFSPDSWGFQAGISTRGVTVSSGPSFGSDGAGYEGDVEYSKSVPGSEHSNTRTIGPETITTTTDEYTGIVVAKSADTNPNEPNKGVCTKTELERASGVETNVTVRIGGKVVSSITTGTEHDTPVASSNERCTGESGKKSKPQPKTSPQPRTSPQPTPISGPHPQPFPWPVPPLPGWTA